MHGSDLSFLLKNEKMSIIIDLNKVSEMTAISLSVTDFVCIRFIVCPAVSERVRLNRLIVTPVNAKTESICKDLLENLNRTLLRAMTG